MGKKDGPETAMQQSFFNARNLYYPTSEDFYFFNKEFGYDYEEQFLDECFKTSLEIADKCNFDFKVGANNYPKFNLPEGTDHIEYCTQIAFEGLQQKLQKRIEEGEKFSDELLTKYEQRLEYEIKVIGDKGYIDYFLIYWDLVRWAKKENIYCGPGRGSAAGALIAYCLGIVTIDPLKFGLYFERFMNPERNCVTENNYVLMKDGSSKKIEQIEVESKVQTPQGKGNLVQIFQRDLEEGEKVFLIELETGVKMELTSKHIVPIERGGKCLEVRVSELREADLLTIF